MEIKYRKTYVTVYVSMAEDGIVRPLSFRWTDGNRYKIDKIRYIERAAATKVGGYGMRYTVMVEGKERYFFLEDGVKWFVEEEFYA